jgi:hypothetical protein
MQTALPRSYSKQKVRNPLKVPKNSFNAPSHLRMKKLLLITTVLVGGMALSQAGINIRINLGLPLPPLPPLPLPAVVIHQPAVVYTPPLLLPPIPAPPCVVVPRPPAYYYQPRYEPGRGEHWRGHGNWGRHEREQDRRR